MQHFKIKVRCLLVVKATQAPSEIYLSRSSLKILCHALCILLEIFQALQNKNLTPQKKYFAVTGFNSDNTIWVKFFRIVHDLSLSELSGFLFHQAQLYKDSRCVTTSETFHISPFYLS